EVALVSRARSHQRERAQALIEFAFIAPVMLVLLIAIVDFSVAIDKRLVLQNAIREGARFGAVHETGTYATTTEDIRDRVVSQAPENFDATNVKVCYVNKGGSPGPGDVGDSVHVEAINYSWPFP